VADFGGSNLEAVKKTLAALDLGAEHSALGMACLDLAALVDERPQDTDLWREYRLVLKALGEAADGGEEPDAFDDWLRAQIRDTEDGPAHARAEVRGSG
jgi:hypothetical protein